MRTRAPRRRKSLDRSRCLGGIVVLQGHGGLGLGSCIMQGLLTGSNGLTGLHVVIRIIHAKRRPVPTSDEPGTRYQPEYIPIPDMGTQYQPDDTLISGYGYRI
jgi:hypothetical protein